MIIKKIEIETDGKKSTINNVDTVKHRASLTEKGVDVDAIETQEAHRQEIAQYESAVQKYLDEAAQEKGYENILSACTYAGFSNPYMEEGQKYTKMRGLSWKYCYNQLQLVEAGQTKKPTIEELVIKLPKFEDM